MRSPQPEPMCCPPPAESATPLQQPQDQLLSGTASGDSEGRRELDKVLHELDELLIREPEHDFDAQLEQLNARIDAVQLPSSTMAAKVASTIGTPAAAAPRPRRLVPKPIARAAWKPAVPEDDAPPICAEQLDIEESWRSSYLAHADRQQAEAVAALLLVAPGPAPHSELSSDRLEDLLDLAELNSVAWPPGLDARIARQILASRASQRRA